MKSLIFLFLLAFTVPPGHAQTGIGSWPAPGAVRRGQPLLLVQRDNPARELPCRLDSIEPDAVVCDTGKHKPPAIYSRSSMSLIETAPRDFHAMAVNFLRGGLLTLAATALCAAVVADPACLATAALSGGLLVSALVCSLIETNNAIFGLNRRRILYVAGANGPTAQENPA